MISHLPDGAAVFGGWHWRSPRGSAEGPAPLEGSSLPDAATHLHNPEDLATHHPAAHATPGAEWKQRN